MSSRTLPEIRSKLTELSNGLKRSIHLIRGVSYDLHPAALDKLGLVRALNQYCQDFSQQTGIAVDFLPVGINGLNLDFDTEINLYRVVQEALNTSANTPRPGRYRYGSWLRFQTSFFASKTMETGLMSPGV
jgi:Signal transduction histidine kinase